MNGKIYISGMHSGQNPCSGVGISRSIRRAFPNLRLVGVDHWQGSSGLHDASVDEVMLFPQWKQIDDERHATQIREILDDGNLWISALDMEVHWLAENVGSHPNLLAPGEKAIDLTAKPTVQALTEIGFKVPDFISASLPDSEIHAFLRHNSWQCWLKSPFHDAKRVSSWGVFERSRAAMSKNWRTSNLFIQRHVFGNEETIAFTAYQGELLNAARMEKRQITPEGKTWAGRVSPVDAETFERLREGLKRIEWNGGGELEYVRDPDGQIWVIECNPRFPAWIQGGAFAGLNLPARLVSKVWGLPFVESTATYPCFTRVVQEIPAREAVGLPLPPDPTSMIWTTDGKKGKGVAVGNGFLPALNSSLEEEDEETLALQIRPETPPTPYLKEVDEIAAGFEGETPARIHLELWTTSRFERLATRVAEARGKTPAIRIGYSIKTSPTDDHLRKARKHGFLAEAISQLEVQRALDHGYARNEVILNGPGKFWPTSRPPITGLRMIFSDSVEEFDKTIQIPGIAQVMGFRMRIPKLHSRFGNALDDFENFTRIVDRVRKLKGKAELGFHFHMPSWSIGLKRWSDALQSLTLWCQTLERVAEVPVRHLDLGGGFFPGDLDALDIGAIQDQVHSILPEVQTLYFEPGRSLTQDGEVLVTRVLDVRRDSEGRVSEAVVDGCIAELPLAQAYSHRVFYRSAKGSDSQLLRKGRARLLGRICMEDDILADGLEVPETLSSGDFVIFGDAGGYERTMSYVFGRG